MLAQPRAAPAIPANLSERVRILWIDGTGRPVLRDFDEGVDVAEVFGGRAARPFPAWPGKRTFNGWYWCRSTEGMVPFESLFEREAIMVLDFDLAVVDIVAQPFALLWPRSASHHFPDLLVRHADGSVAMVDVRPRERIDPQAEHQFALTRQAADQAGWGYTVYTSSAEPLVSNLTFLAGFRKHCCDPDPEAVKSLRAVFNPAAALGVGIGWAQSATSSDPRTVRTAALSMLWHQRLHADLTAGPLSDATVVST